MRFENISFQSVACLFILLMEIFMEQKILTLMKTNLPFFFMVCDFVILVSILGTFCLVSDPIEFVLCYFEEDCNVIFMFKLIFKYYK